MEPSDTSVSFQQRLVVAFISGLVMIGLVHVPVHAQHDSDRKKTSVRAADNWMKRCRNDHWQDYSSDFEGVSVNELEARTARFEATTPRAACKDARAISPRIALGATQIEFEGGAGPERWARVVPDPDDPKNHVLRFWLGGANVRNERGNAIKGRIQLNAYGNKSVREVEVTVRARLSGAFGNLSAQSGTFGWLTIAEYWNNATWTKQDYPFRISVNIVKDEAGGGRPLRFSAHAQSIDRSSKRAGFSNVWSETAHGFIVPVDRWMTLKYRLVEGGPSTGRFRMTVTPEGQSEVVLFDVRGATHHPEDPSPDGVSHFNPIKLYTSAKLLGEARGGGDGLIIDWDDLSIKLKDDS